MILCLICLLILNQISLSNMEKLISMVDFVIKTYEEVEDTFDSEQMMFYYARFLKQPLIKGIFVSCDEDDNVLDIPNLENYSIDEDGSNLFNLRLKKYKEAKERVLFEGFEFQKSEKEGNYYLIRFPIKTITPLYPKLWQGLTVEDLVKYNLTLTASAIKQFGL